MVIEQSPLRRSPDPTLTDLGEGERALLAAIRLWHRGYPDTTAALAPMRGRLRQGGIPEAVLLPLLTFLGVFSQNTRRPLVSRSVDCARIGADERALLAVFAAQQRRDAGLAVEILGRWLSPIARCQCLDSATQVADGFSRCSPAVVLGAPEAAAGPSSLDYLDAAD